MSEIKTFEELDKEIRKIFKNVNSEFCYTGKVFVKARIYITNVFEIIYLVKRKKYKLVASKKKKYFKNLNNILLFVVSAHKCYELIPTYLSNTSTIATGYHFFYVKDCVENEKALYDLIIENIKLKNKECDEN